MQEKKEPGISGIANDITQDRLSILDSQPFWGNTVATPQFPVHTRVQAVMEFCIKAGFFRSSHLTYPVRWPNHRDDGTFSHVIPMQRTWHSNVYLQPLVKLAIVHTPLGCIRADKGR